MAHRAGRGSGDSSGSDRGGAPGLKYEAGRSAVGLPGEPGDTAGCGGTAEEQEGEWGGSPGTEVYVARCGSATAGAAGGGGVGGGVCHRVCMSVQELSYCLCLPCCCTVLLQHGADPNIRNTDGKSALDLAEPSAKAVLTGQLPVCLSDCVSVCLCHSLEFQLIVDFEAAVFRKCLVLPCFR